MQHTNFEGGGRFPLLALYNNNNYVEKKRCIIILNSYLTSLWLQVIFGERKTRPAKMDQGVAEAILSYQDDTSFNTVLGGTMCTDDFYEGIAVS